MNTTDQNIYLLNTVSLVTESHILYGIFESKLNVLWHNLNEYTVTVYDKGCINIYFLDFLRQTFLPVFFS